MVSKAIKAKAASFDVSKATESLSRALDATGLTDNPAKPCDDIAALVAVALACGADAQDAASIADDNSTPANAPPTDDNANDDQADGSGDADSGAAADGVVAPPSP
jgi:hypothetical protein